MSKQSFHIYFGGVCFFEEGGDAGQKLAHNLDDLPVTDYTRPRRSSVVPPSKVKEDPDRYPARRSSVTEH